MIIGSLSVRMVISPSYRCVSHVWRASYGIGVAGHFFGGLKNKGDELDIFMTLEYSRSFSLAEMLDNILYG